jgi:hypothetical protein
VWCRAGQNVPSAARVAAGAFGFLIFSHAFDGPDLYGASSFFETMPQRLALMPRDYRTTKLVSKLLSIGQTSKAPTNMPAAILLIFLVHPMRYYAEASVEIIHGLLGCAAFGQGNLDYKGEV